MKTLSKNLLPDILSNPINRDLILILAAALAIATFMVTATVIVYNQW